MKPLYKQTLILFSAALNIGFLITAVTFVLHDSGRHKNISVLIDMVYDLGLPEEKENSVVTTMNEFVVLIKKQHEDIKKVREDIMDVLAKKGKLDKKKMRRFYEALNHEELSRNRLFEEHLSKLREIMGDEKGAMFFSMIKEKYKKRDGHNKK